MVESDSLLVIHEIHKQKASFCEWESLIMDIIGLFLEYNSCSFNHVRRSVNGCAHNIAKIPFELRDMIV